MCTFAFTIILHYLCGIEGGGAALAATADIAAVQAKADNIFSRFSFLYLVRHSAGKGRVEHIQ